ncbi:MAG: terminase small subunit-like protein [Phenylobacterium sp.]
MRVTIMTRGGEPARVGESKFAPEIGDAIVARVGAGESITAICRDEAMPCRNTVKTWSRQHPEFGAELMAAMRGARLAARLRDRARWAAHEAARRPRGRGSTYRREVGEAICERLANGESLTAIARDEGLPSYATILRWVSRHADFQALYVEAREIQAHYYFDEARDVARAATPGSVWVSRLQFDIIRWQTARLAPHKYSERVVVEAAISARRIEDDPRLQPMTVIVKRYGDVTAEDLAEHDATQAAFARLGR